MFVGMDGNEFSPWWRPATAFTNLLGELIGNLTMELDLEIVNHPNCTPAFVSDMGHNTWIDWTPATHFGTLSVLDWKVNIWCLIGSDHRAIFFSTSSRPSHSEVFQCKAWDQVDRDAFCITMSQACWGEGVLPAPPPEGMAEHLSTAAEIEHQVAHLRAILYEAIDPHMLKKRICWMSKP